MARKAVSFGYEEVLEKVSRAVNGRFPSENAVKPRENIMRRRDSACIRMSQLDLRQEFSDSDDNVDGAFMFQHPTIELMAQSLCGQCPCLYCCKNTDVKEPASSSAPDSVEEDRPEVPSKEPASFTQLVGLTETTGTTSLYEEVAGSRIRRSTDGMESIRMEGGIVWIGSSLTAAGGCKPTKAEMPCHQVTLDSFLIDVEPVSIGSYARFLNIVKAPLEALMDWFLLRQEDERRQFLPLVLDDAGLWTVNKVSERWPMYLVSWYGANAYSLWANGADWRSYREATGSFLPTEAQWEFAARGENPKSFPWGNAPATPDLLQVGWTREDFAEDIASVDQIRFVDVNVAMGVTASGLRHMAGNVWQWCRDTFDPNFYVTQEAREKNAWNSEPEGLKSERGGSWVGPACLARSSYRRGRAAEAQGRCLGFRCVGDVSLVSVKNVGDAH